MRDGDVGRWIGEERELEDEVERGKKGLGFKWEWVR